MGATTRVDDGSHKTMPSSKLVTNCILSGIGNVSKIQPVTIGVELNENSEAINVTFSKMWTVARNFLRLTVRRLAYVDVNFLVPDDSLEDDYVLPGLPMLKHLIIYNEKILEKTVHNLGGAHCSNIQPNV